jgi:cyclopropane-fatty-acyl-phospholipid synthase
MNPSVSIRNRALAFLRSRLGDQPPALRLVFWDGESFDFAPAPAVTIKLRSPRVLKALVRGNFSYLGDAYVAGDITADGTIEDIIETGITLAERLGKSPLLGRLYRFSQFIPRWRSRREEAANISYHYDVSNDFYQLWLDDNMVYSCAYFRTGSEDIHAAQRQKLDHICRKLLLKPGERLLDVGCGWGGLLRWAASRYGVNGVGITLSERQHAYARAWLAAERLDDRIEIRLQNYRDLADEEPFDKIVSVGMYEHVGLANLGSYFATVARLLRPGGAFLNQGIVTTDPEGGPRGPPGGEFIDRYVFPGGALPNLPRTALEFARAGLEVADVEDLRPHYARTLQAWVRRLEGCRQQAMRAAGADRYLIWRAYLAGMACAFDRGWLSVAQVLAFKPREDGFVLRPWSRDYQYGNDREAALATGLDWRTRG